jgi:hypothetical protein
VIRHDHGRDHSGSCTGLGDPGVASEPGAIRCLCRGRPGRPGFHEHNCDTWDLVRPGTNYVALCGNNLAFVPSRPNAVSWLYSESSSRSIGPLRRRERCPSASGSEQVAVSFLSGASEDRSGRRSESKTVDASKGRADMWWIMTRGRYSVHDGRCLCPGVQRSC